MSVLRTEHIVKQYPGCLALNDVSVSFESGKVNALLGKNGSGKSTLVKCFSGAIQPTSGTFYLDDEPLRFAATADANARGFATVYQDPEPVRRGKYFSWPHAEKRRRDRLEKSQ